MQNDEPDHDDSDDRVDTSDSGDASASLRKVTDARELRALAHPVRITLLELVGLNGPLTASKAAEIIGGTPANAAYHLRTLAKYGYVTEAEGGVGRERPWQLGGVGMSISDDDPDPAVSHAATALADIVTERWLDRIQRYRANRDKYPDEVRKVSGSSGFVLFANEAEVEQVQTEVLQIMMRYMDRLTDPSLRPQGAKPYEIVVSTHPLDYEAPTNLEG